MLFNSWQFLIFFPLVTILYFLFPHKKRWLLLLVASCIFYMAFIPQYILILFLLILVDYGAGRLIQSSKGSRKKIYLSLSILSTVFILFIFKYFNFFVGNYTSLANILGWEYVVPHLNIILPLGLSFHTFQSLAYVIEVYRGNFKAEKNFGIYALYVMFYPQLVAGPIERPQNLLPQLRKKYNFDYQRVISGLKLMLWGFFKKLVIADSLAVVVDQAYRSPGDSSGMFLLVATYAFAFQILCDFSGYTDIARGAAEVMGFKLMINFNRPYISKSVAEFWTRWHISLGSWFKDYLYIPLGGSRKGTPMWVGNLLAVFLISGLWHGADWKFVIWGGLLGVFIVVSAGMNYFKKRFIPQLSLPSGLSNILSVIITFNLISFTWIFFRAVSVSDALTIIRKIFFEFAGLGQILAQSERLIIGLFFVIVMELVYVLAKERPLPNLFAGKPKVLRWGFYYFIIFSIIFFGEFSELKFIYFQF